MESFPQLGPMRLDKLIRCLSRRKLRRDVQVWREGMQNCVPAVVPHHLLFNIFGA